MLKSLTCETPRRPRIQAPQCPVQDVFAVLLTVMADSMDGGGQPRRPGALQELTAQLGVRSLAPGALGELPKQPQTDLGAPSWRLPGPRGPERFGNDPLNQVLPGLGDQAVPL